MAYSRTFDQSRVAVELDRIQQWLRTCGIDPSIVPANATIVFHRRRMTVEVFRRGPHGLVLNADRTDVSRDRRVVRLHRRPPALRSLSGPCRRTHLVQPGGDR